MNQREYEQAQFADAFARYLPGQSATPLQNYAINDLHESETAIPRVGVALSNEAKLLNTKDMLSWPATADFEH
jgi:hypothetical protein